jgi:aminopeptidase
MTMIDPRQRILAQNLIKYSLKLQNGEKVWINLADVDDGIAAALVEETYKAGAYPFVVIDHGRVTRQVLRHLTEEQAEMMMSFDLPKMQAMDAFIGVRGSHNVFESVDVDEAIQRMYSLVYYKPVHMQTRLKKKWVVLRYPNPSMAQLAQMSTDAFEDFYFSVCNLDYAKMSRAMDPLVELLHKTDRVRIVSPGTDLAFSIKDIPVIKCDGERNIPDGEVYTAPVLDSVNGVIAYNTPSMVSGFKFENIRFVFKDGKIVEATSNDNARVNKHLDTDAGARYVGEFAIGVNPNITFPMLDTLFDEKIAGSFHFTPGNAYDEADNGNKSSVHWDLIQIQTPEYGGGEIWFDDVLVRKDGLFVIPELLGLNPENLR